jgi:hypothetical protein
MAHRLCKCQHDDRPNRRVARLSPNVPSAGRAKFAEKHGNGQFPEAVCQAGPEFCRDWFSRCRVSSTEIPFRRGRRHGSHIRIRNRH